MAGYSRMELMRKTDEELKAILRDEGEELPGYMVAMIIEELKNRKDAPEESAEVSEEESFEDAFDPEEDEDLSKEDEAEDSYEDEENEADLTEEEKLQKGIAESEKEQKESKRTLRIVLIATATAAVILGGVLLWAALSGNLQ